MLHIVEDFETHEGVVDLKKVYERLGDWIEVDFSFK